MFRHSLIGLGSMVLATTAAAQIQESAVTTIVDDEENGRIEISIGPFHLPAGADHDHGGHSGIFSPVAELEMPRHAYLHGFEWDVVNGAGEDVPDEVLHHMNIIDPVRRELFLPISQRMMAVGNETGGYSMPRFLFGYPVRRGQPVVVTTMMHNPTGRELEDVYVKFHFKYMDVGRPWPFFEVYPFQLDVAFPAGDKSFDLPPGRSSYSYEASPAMDGRIIGLGAHMHQLGESIVFEDVTTGDTIWQGLPVEDDEGNLEEVTLGRLYRKGGEPIYSDHTYRVTVTYDNPGPDTIPEGGMGVVGGVFSPVGGYPWPIAETADTLYQIDRAHYMRRVRGKLDEIVGILSSGDTQGTESGNDGGHTH